jgi:hypothetical protein
MIGKPIYVFIKPIYKAGFDNFNRLRVKGPTQSQQHRSIGNLAGEFMLKGIFESDTLHFPYEIRSFKRLKVSTHPTGGDAEHLREQRHRKVGADHGSSLEQGLWHPVQSIDTGGQDGVDRLRNFNPPGRLV